MLMGHNKGLQISICGHAWVEQWHESSCIGADDQIIDAIDVIRCVSIGSFRDLGFKYLSICEVTFELFNTLLSWYTGIL